MEFIKELETSAEYASLELIAIDARTFGVEGLYSKFVSPESIKTRYNERVYRALMKQWSEMEIRHLQIHLHSATNIPVRKFCMSGAGDGPARLSLAASMHR